MQTKICSKCGIEKDISCFGKHKLHKDGLSSWCKKCKSQENKEYYQTNRNQRR